jgi:hypothetical protein
MTDQKKAGKALQAEQRRARLAQQLRANLRKRKQQARGRAQVAAPADDKEGLNDKDGC